jgi:hypothetical protein
MKSTSQILTVLIAFTLIGSVIAIAVSQQASAARWRPEIRVQFEKLSEQFVQDVSDLVAGDPPTEADPPSETTPPDPDKLAALFDNYEQETFRIFELEPPSETTPPDPEAEPPDPELSR